MKAPHSTAALWRLPVMALFLFGCGLPIAAAAPTNTIGQVIAFSAAGLEGEGIGGIWLVQPNGTKFRQLNSFANPIIEIDDIHGMQLPEDHPAISPDGKKIAFVSNRGHAFNKELYLMDINGANRRRLTDSPDLDTEPSWSPDGKRIVFATSRYGSVLNLAILDVATLSVTRLTTSGLEDNEPAWHPNGQTIAFTRSLAEGSKSLRLVETNGTNNRLLFDEPGEDHDASWNPNGSKLAITSEMFTSRPYGGTVIINADGSNPIDVTSDFVFGAGDPSWSPDGSKIAFFHTFFPFLHSPQHLFVMNANGSSKVQLDDKGIVNVHPNFGWMVDTDQDGRADYLENSNQNFSEGDFRNTSAGAMFGHAMAFASFAPAPDFHAMAIGLPGGGGGRVIVRYFTSDGFLFNVFVAASGDVQPVTGFDSSFWGIATQTGGRFGQTLAAGDFDNDGLEEIAIGAPGMGRVFILNGKATVPKRVLTDVGSFGSALAVGDFNRDGFDDLAVGAPMRSFSGQANAGEVHVYWGTINGLVDNHLTAIDQDDLPTGDLGGREANDNFGFALAAGSVIGDLADDLVISAPGETYNSVAAAGAVFIVPGINGLKSFSFNGASTRDARSLPAPFTGPQSNARFGEALALARFGGIALAKMDLAVGIPSQNIGGVADAGLVAVYSSSLVSVPRNATLAFCRTNLPGSATLQSIRFGHTLCAGEFSGDAATDLAVAAPRSTLASGAINVSEAGAVFIIHGAKPPSGGTITACSMCPPLPTTPVIPLSGGGLHLASAQRVDLSQCDGTFGSQDHFGANLQFAAPNALAAFDFDADGQRELFIGVPEANADGDADSGLFAIRYGLKVGRFTLSPSHVTTTTGQAFTLALEWTHPNLWTNLDTVELRLAADEGVFFWLRLSEATRTLSLYDHATGDFGLGLPFGTAGVLSNAWASVNVAQSQLVTSGPEGRIVTMRFRLTPSAHAACRRFQVELFASDDHGNAQGFDPAGVIDCGNCAPQITQGQFEFRFPTETSRSYTVQSRPLASESEWSDRQTTAGTGNIQSFRDPVNGTQRYYRLRVN